MMDKPKLICTCGKQPELKELSGNDFDDYAARCECGIAWQIRDVTEELDEQDPKANGFHNTPAECEDRECNECELDADARTRLGIDCPYIDEDNENQCIGCGKQIPEQGFCGDCAAT